MEKKITKDIFDCTKKLLESGESQRKIAAWMNLSQNTVWVFGKVDSYEEYREYIVKKSKADRDKKKQELAQPLKHMPQPEPQPQIREVPPPMASAYQMNRLIENQNKQIELLTLISRKLAYIVEELTGKPEEMTK